MDDGYKIGQTFPLEQGRDIVAGPPIDPVWYALIVPQQKEAAVCGYLKRKGVYAFYPSETRKWRVRGIKVQRDFPIISRHIYAMFRQAPQWDVMKERQRLISGVFAVGERPLAIPRDVIRHLQGMTVEAERLKDARAELLRVRMGDRATISDGPLSGFAVDVEKVSGGMAWFAFLTGGKGRADVASLSRVVPDSERKELEKGLPDDPTSTIVTDDAPE